MSWYLEVLKKYAAFSGRARREEAFYTQAWDEVNCPNRTLNKATWAKAFSISHGDEKKTQAKYIGLRVVQLQEEQTARFLQLKAEQEQARLAETSVESEESTVEVITSEELHALTKKIQSDNNVYASEDLIKKLGGTWQKDMGWFSVVIRVRLWNKNHEFDDPRDAVSWVRRDVIPRVMDEFEKAEKNAT